ncbi:MAG TPA: hypothetical protein VIR79_02285 [Nitrospira sp.]
MRRGSTIIGCDVVLAMVGCAVTGQLGAASVQARLLRKSEQEIFTVSGDPGRRIEDARGVRLIYRDEPTMLERSFPSARGTVTCPHHGCEAHVLVENGRTAEVEYHPFPEGGDCDHCDRIFARCNP